MCLEYSDYGTGDFRSPSFYIRCTNSSTITPLKYKSYQIIPGKPILPHHLPSIYGESPSMEEQGVINPNDATTLIITMWDNIVGLEVSLYMYMICKETLHMYVYRCICIIHVCIIIIVLQGEPCSIIKVT